MPASLTFYESFREYIADGTFDLNSNTFKVTLHNSTYTPNAGTHSVFTDATNQLTTANGYVSGGITLTGVVWTRTGATVKFDANDPVWTASGGSIVARYAVISATGTLNGRADPLVAFILMDNTPADVATTIGNTLTLQFNASGILTLS
jgi:hypothetical protein